MWSYETSLETRASAEAVFEFFRDVASWPEWNAGVERIELEGPFAGGTSGTMVVPGEEPLAFRLVWVGEGRGFEDETPIPDAGVVVRVRHTLDPLASGGTRITYVATVEGPAADAAGPEIGTAVTADFPEVMAALAARAEAAEATASR
jgi:uncharacterized protein YndB with AHSA1/START domain